MKQQPLLQNILLLLKHWQTLPKAIINGNNVSGAHLSKIGNGIHKCFPKNAQHIYKRIFIIHVNVDKSSQEAVNDKIANKW